MLDHADFSGPSRQYVLLNCKPYTTGIISALKGLTPRSSMVSVRGAECFEVYTTRKKEKGWQRPAERKSASVSCVLLPGGSDELLRGRADSRE